MRSGEMRTLRFTIRPDGNSNEVSAQMPWWMRHQIDTGHFTVSDDRGQRCLECADTPWVDDFLVSASSATKIDQLAAWLLTQHAE